MAQAAFAGGAVSAQSVCLLPDRKPVRHQVQRLLASVRAGRHGRSLTVTVDDEAEYAGLVAEFNAERDAEYAEVVERAPQLLAELETETARGRATYAEVEESEADLERFDSGLPRSPPATISPRRRPGRPSGGGMLPRRAGGLRGRGHCRASWPVPGRAARFRAAARGGLNQARSVRTCGGTR